jgi:sugar/nucleoside kinase (ribokinase family)
MAKKIDVWMVGSIGIDDVETRDANRKELLGGSLPFATAAASFAGANVGAVGVVGSDFPKAFVKRWTKFGTDLEGVQHKVGLNFRWAGKYDENMIDRATLRTELGVFADFSPALPESYRNAPFVLLGNIQPDLQFHVLKQAKKPKFVALDSMNLWIDIALPSLKKIIGEVDLLTVNDGEARQLTGKWNLRDCATEILKMGPSYVLLKKGEHGALLFTKKEVFIVPAYPVKTLKDPTGAGDTYAGAFMGYLSKAKALNVRTMRKALFFASAMASFCVEGFSIERLEKLTKADVVKRTRELEKMASL